MHEYELRGVISIIIFYNYKIVCKFCYLKIPVLWEKGYFRGLSFMYTHLDNEYTYIFFYN